MGVVGVAGDGGAGFVALLVVEWAEEPFVVDVGGSAVLPLGDVVDFAPCGGGGAVFVAAVAVSGDECEVVVVGGVAGLASEVEDFGAGHDDALQCCVFGGFAYDVGGDAVSPGCVAGFVGGTGESVDGDDDHDVWVGASGYELAGVVELGECDGAVGEALGVGACVTFDWFACCMVDCV